MLDDSWWLEPDEERRPDHRPICHSCGNRIDGDTVWVHCGNPFHRECLKEIFKEEAREEIKQRLRDAIFSAEPYRE